MRIKIKGKGTRKPSSPSTEPDFYAMPYLPDTDFVNRGPSRDQQGVVPIPQAAPLARLTYSQSFIGECLLNNAFCPVPSMPLSASAMRAIAEGQMLPSEDTQSFLSNLALNAQRERLLAANLSDVMLNMSVAMPALSAGYSSLPENSQFAAAAAAARLALGLQSTVPYANHTAPVVEYVRRALGPQRLHLLPAHLSNAMLNNMSVAMPALPTRYSSVQEHSQFAVAAAAARVAGMQSLASYANGTAPENYNLAGVDEYVRQRDQRLAGIMSLYDGRMHR